MERKRSNGPKVALVVMPYFSTRYGSVQCGLLKSVLAREGFESDVLYLNLPFAREVGIEFYETLAHEQYFLAEWSFARTLRRPDPSGRGHARRRWRALSRTRGFAPERYAEVEKQVEPFLRRCVEERDWSAYGLVGFSSVFYNQFASLCLAKRLKKRYPGIKIVFGGPNVEGEMGLELLRAYPWVDFVVDGEGEQALIDLAASIRTGSQDPIPGVASRVDGIVRAPASRSRRLALDQLPFADYHDYFSGLKAAGLASRVEPYLQFEGSRGCWWGEKSHCTFCGLNGQNMAYRSKSPERLLSELEHLSRTYKVSSFSATDNILDLRYFDSFFPALRGKTEAGGLSLDLFFETKSNLTRKHVAALQASGVRRIQPGVESLSSEVLRLMRKGVTSIQNLQLLRACREFGLDAIWLVLYGFPGEKPEHYRETLELMAKTTHLQPPSRVQPFSLTRFSPYFDHGERWGVVRAGPCPDAAVLYSGGAADASRIAYDFQHRCERGPRRPEVYIEPVRRFCERWNAELAAKTFFHFSQGAGFVRLYDYRLASPSDAQPRLRKRLLEGWKAEVYRFCVDLKTTGEILEFLKKGSGESVARKTLLRTLKAWNREGLLVTEGVQHLSLALPMPANMTAFQTRWQMLEALERSA